MNNLAGWIPLTIMTLMHLWVFVDWMVKKNYPMAVVFLCYAIATGGFLWEWYNQTYGT